ncbi:hypothetical protein SKB0092_12430 [Roseomonas mucosa]
MEASVSPVLSETRCRLMARVGMDPTVKRWREAGKMVHPVENFPFRLMPWESRGWRVTFHAGEDE